MTTRNTKLAVVGAVLVALSMVGPMMSVAATAPSVDTETTDTTTESALNDGDTVLNFDANSSENISTLQASFDSQNPKVKILDPRRGNVTLNSFTEGDMTQTGSASGTYYYNLTMTEGDFEYAETNALKNKTMYLQLVNDTSVDEPDTTNISITLEETGGRTVRVVGDTTDGLSAFSEYEIAGYSIGIPYLSSSQADFEADSLPTSDNGTVVVHAENSTLTDQLGAFDSYAEEAPITGMSVKTDDGAIPVFVSSAPDDVDGAYAVADLSSNDLELHNVENGTTDVSVSTIGVNPWTAYQLYGFSGLNPLSMGGGAVGMSLLIVFGPRSLRDRRQEA